MAAELSGSHLHSKLLLLVDSDQPDERVLQELLGRACPNDPYGRPILGWKDRLIGMTPEAMRDFHGRRYRGPDCCLAIAAMVDLVH